MKNKSIFSRLLANKKLVIILSFVLALIFWIITSDNISTTIGKVPLKHNLSEKVAAEFLAKVFHPRIRSKSHFVHCRESPAKASILLVLSVLNVG